MKLLDRLISFIFSLAILILAVTVILVTLGYVNADKVYSILHQYVFAEEVKQISLITAIVVFLAALKVTIFNSRFKSSDRGPILVETNHGVIEISQDTIENTVRSVAGDFPEIKDVQAKMVKKNKGIKVYTAISVLANTNIRALTGELQEKVEQVIDETTGIKILSTNIKVKNIYEKNKKTTKVEPTQKKSPVVVSVPETENVIEKHEEEAIQGTDDKIVEEESKADAN